MTKKGILLNFAQSILMLSVFGIQHCQCDHISTHLPLYAVAVINPGNSAYKMKGYVEFSQLHENGPVRIKGSIETQTRNTDHGFHIHEFGDQRDPKNMCLSSGSHFNPYNETHGAPSDEHRHVGDLGNIKSDQNGISNFDFHCQIISLCGPNSVIGRTIAVHEFSDDFGRGGTKESLINGNTGTRVACGIIGFRKKSESET